MSIRDLHYDSKHLLNLLEKRSMEFKEQESVVQKLRVELETEKEKHGNIAVETVQIKEEILRRIAKKRAIAFTVSNVASKFAWTT